MYITNEDRFFPINVIHITDPRVDAVSNKSRSLRSKFFRYMWIAFAVYVGLCANLG